MAKSKLAKMLLEDKTIESSSASMAGLTKIGVEHITNISQFLKSKLRNWDKGIEDYDSLFEIAKIAFLTDKEDVSLRCHMELARYQYPQIRSLEIQSKEDKEIKISVQLADYARAKTIDADIEDIEAQPDDNDEEHQVSGKDYTDFVLAKSDKSDSGDGE